MSVITDLIPTTLPAYHEKYRVGGYNRLGKLCYASILRRTEASEGNWPIEVNGAGASPVTISTSYADKDFFSPVSGSSCKISMVAESYSQLLELGRGDDTMWKVEVVDDGDTIFRGFLKPETFQMEYGYEKPVVNVDATDGLGLLRGVNYPHGEEEPLYGTEYANRLMAYILYQAGNRENWEDHVTYRFSHAEANFLRSWLMPVSKYHGWNLYDVLLDILDVFKAQIVQKNGKYIIRLLDKPDDTEYEVFTYKGDFVSRTSRSDSIIDIYGNYQGGSGELTVERPVKNLIMSRQLTPIGSLIFNGDFSKGDSGWYDHIHDPDWHVEDGYLEFLFGGVQSFQHWLHNYDLPYVKSESFERTPIVAALKFLVSFQFSTNHEGSFNIQASIGNAVVRKGVSEGVGDLDVYYTYEAILTLEANDTPVFRVSQAFRIWNNPDPQLLNISYIKTRIKNVRVVCIGRSTPPHINDLVGDDEVPDVPEAITREDTTEIQPNNIEEKTFEIGWDHHNVYKYDNALHPPFVFFDGPFPFPAFSRIFPLLRNRARSFYGKPRKRLSLSMYEKADSIKIHPQHQFFDKFFRRVLVLMSYEYDLRMTEYSMELMEYRIADPDEFARWILAFGEWDDEGFWMDNKNWHDTDPT